MLDKQSIASLDAFAGALAPGRVHILSGMTGTGKSAVSLRFIGAGLERWDRALLLTSMRPRDLRSLATFLGLELEAAIAEDRLIILRHGRELSSRLARPGALYGAVDELATVVESIRPERIAIDTVAPFLAGDGASPVAIARLAEMLEIVGATAIVTVPGRVDDAYDRRLDPLVQDAAGIFHLSHEADGSVAVDTVTIRMSSFAPLPSRLTLGRPPTRGILAEERGGSRPGLLGAIGESGAHGNGRRTGLGSSFGSLPMPSDVAPGAPAKQVAWVHVTPTADPELVSLLRESDYDVRILPARSAETGLPSALALVVEMTWQSLDTAIETIEALRVTEGDAPIIAISPFDLRSTDRSRVLRAGADEFLTRAMGPAEFLERVALGIRRRRAAEEPPAIADESEQPPAVVRLTPRNGDVRELADLVTNSVRVATGDSAQVSEGSVIVRLHGIRRRDTVFFADRIKTQWVRRGHGTLYVDSRESGRGLDDVSVVSARPGPRVEA